MSRSAETTRPCSGDQPRQHAPLPRPAEVGRVAVDGDFQRAEHPNPDHRHLADKVDKPHSGSAATGPQAGRKSAASAPAQARTVTSTPPFAPRARTTQEPEPDLTSIVVIHRAIRQDLRRLTACLAEIPRRGAPPSQARAIGRYTTALLAEIRAHHHHEDDIIWPVIAATAGQAVDLTPLTDDHQAIDAAVGRASQALVSFTADTGAAAAALRASISELRDMLEEHIADEEEQIFPAMRRYLPADAYQRCQKQIQRTASLPGVRFTAPWLARHAQPDELSRLLAAGGWPARIVLAAARPGYARLERQAFVPARPPSHPPHTRSRPLDATPRPGTVRPAHTLRRQGRAAGITRIRGRRTLDGRSIPARYEQIGDDHVHAVP